MLEERLIEEFGETLRAEAEEKLAEMLADQPLGYASALTEAIRHRSRLTATHSLFLTPRIYACIHSVSRAAVRLLLATAVLTMDVTLTKQGQPLSLGMHTPGAIQRPALLKSSMEYTCDQ